MQMAKEEYAIVLDYLSHGHLLDRRPIHRKAAIALAIGKEHFLLLELVLKKGVTLQLHEEVYIGEGKRDKIHYIAGRIFPDKLTETAKTELKFVLQELVNKNEARFVEFFNKSLPINVRIHQLELLPGVGKKHAAEIIGMREEKPFSSFEDIRARVKLLPDPEKVIIKRILLELEGNEKHNLFVGV